MRPWLRTRKKPPAVIQRVSMPSLISEGAGSSKVVGPVQGWAAVPSEAQPVRQAEQSAAPVANTNSRRFNSGIITPGTTLLRSGLGGGGAGRGLGGGDGLFREVQVFVAGFVPVAAEPV